jgi:hypothetical protein
MSYREFGDAETLQQVSGKRRKLWPLVIVVVVTVVAVVALWLVPNHPIDENEGPATTPGGSVTGSAVATDGVAWLALMDPGRTEEVAAGLWRCRAASSGGERVLYGVNVGFPRSVDGAVATVASWLRLGFSEQFYVTDSHKAIMAEFSMEPYSVDMMSRMQVNSGINTSGQVLDTGGRVAPEWRFVAGAEPLYGAYQVVSVFVRSDGLQRVLVNMWVPYVRGIVSVSEQRVAAGWAYRSVLAQWDTAAGRWGLYIVGESITDTPHPVPSDTSRVNLSWEERATVLGSVNDPWCVAADATTDPLPDMYLTRS